MYEIVIGRTESEKRTLGLNGTIFIGKMYVRMGQTTSLSNKVLLDVVNPHIILICGKRGSGKSYSLAVIAEEIANLPEEIAQNLSVLILDTMGIFWTMKFPNEREEDLLKTWDLKPTATQRANIFIPKGYFNYYKENKFPCDYAFTISPAELSAIDWCGVFNIGVLDPIGILVDKIIDRLQESKGKDYDIKDIIKEIVKETKAEEKVKNGLENLFTNADSWGLFDKNATPIKEIIDRGKVSIVDISIYKDWNVKCLVASLLSKKLLLERMVVRKLEELKDIEKGYSYFFSEELSKKEQMPLVWILVDECLPYNSLVETDKGKIRIGEIIERINSGDKIMVKGYDIAKDSYDFYNIKKTFKIKPHNLISLKTETGKIIKCTPDHPVLTKEGFISASLADSLAFPLEVNYNLNKKMVMARIIGHILGDGYLSTNQTVGFCGKGNKDLELIKRDLDRLGIKSSNIYERITESKIVSCNGRIDKVIGLSQEMRAGRETFRFFRRIGLPIGKKTDCKTLIPKIILNGSKEEKNEFLAALMGADGHGLTNANNSKLDFNPIRISFNKIEELEDNGWDYANQLVKLFNELDINISRIKKEDANIRVDGKRTIKFIITLEKNVDNTIRFIENIGFRYNTKKEINSMKWLSYLRYYKQKLEKYHNLRNKAIELHQNRGIGKTKIARLLGIEDYRVRDWIYYGRNARVGKELESFEDFVKKRCKNRVLHEKIEKIEFLPTEPLFDIEVDKVHNFIADDTIVHNCHEFLPRVGVTPATDAFVQLLREGRQPGISLVMATQQPGEIHTDAITQSDIVISHRITARNDIESLNNIMQTYVAADIMKYLNELPRMSGSAIVLDDNSERIYPIRVRPRFSWHGGESPKALHMKREELVELGL